MMTLEQAWAFMVDNSGLDAARVMADPAGAYRRAARSLHPDTGGSKASFQRLQEAKRAIELADRWT